MFIFRKLDTRRLCPRKEEKHHQRTSLKMLHRSIKRGPQKSKIAFWGEEEQYNEQVILKKITASGICDDETVGFKSILAPLCKGSCHEVTEGL